ncbi:MAG TPA: branched-chain amino acid aminotransferase [Longimicrobiaceae bacterium]|nr:branched-chain amino acid aminotransferase [Longimicrobiaceae bacterium]
MSTTLPPLAIELSPTATRLGAAERAALLTDPGFGRVFTEHMVTIRHTRERGWHQARLQPYGPLAIPPATLVLHYAQAVFEGLKAYRQPDGGVSLFRPERNAVRFQRSAERLAMPPLPEELFMESIRVLLETDRDWVPDAASEASLYLRPLLFATDPFLGVRPGTEYLYCLMACAVGSYFPRGVKPVTVWVSREYTRAAPGGTGEAKCAGNYAASLVAQAQAVERGCDQVVWLDAVEHRWVEEMGGMNIFFVFADGTLVTPALTGTLLPGVTRESILALAADLGLRAEERRISTDEWREAARSGRMTEAFACGTAAVVTPIGRVKGADGEFTLGDGEPGRITMGVRAALLDLQYGRAPDAHGWMHRIF